MAPQMSEDTHKFTTNSWDSSASSSSEDETCCEPMIMRPDELLDMAIRREARLFRRKDMDLRRMVLLDGLIGKLKRHRRQCRKMRMCRKRKVEMSEVVPKKVAKLEPEEAETNEKENGMDLKERCKMLDILSMIGAARQG